MPKKQPFAPYDLVGNIMAYELGELGDTGVLALFAFLVTTGQARSLPGSYGRTADALIKAGYLDRKGNILKGVEDHV